MSPTGAIRQLGHVPVVLAWPTAGFQRVLEQRRSWVAVLLVLGCTLAAQVVIGARIDRDAVKRLTAQRLTMVSQDKEVSDSALEGEAGRALNIQRIAGYLKTAVLFPGLILLMAVFFWLQLGRASRWIGFRGSLAVAAHVWVPFAVRQLVSIPALLRYPTLDPEKTQGLFKTDLASLFGLERVPLSSCADPFWIWMAILFAVGGRVANWRRWHSVVSGVAVWLLLGFFGRMLT